jgi:hypothetical protein
VLCEYLLDNPTHPHKDVTFYDLYSVGYHAFHVATND